MIVVVGRPGLTADDALSRLAGQIALAASRDGGRVEVVGSVGDDGDGDTIVVQLGRAGIGHAAILRDPAGVTPRDGSTADDTRPMPRLDAGDVDLALRYLPECRVLVVAEPLPEDALRVVGEAATYHGAQLIVMTDSGPANAASDDAPLPESATLLQLPAANSAAFAALVARYAVALDSGRSASDAWRDAVDETGWEQAAE